MQPLPEPSTTGPEDVIHVFGSGRDAIEALFEGRVVDVLAGDGSLHRHLSNGDLAGVLHGLLERLRPRLLLPGRLELVDDELTGGGERAWLDLVVRQVPAELDEALDVRLLAQTLNLVRR
jgi:hypothetical protein